ncbi:DNA polymerase III subunit psi [Vibrio fluvialis]|jgi:DNA polymerase-3 subunit psi|uniref:DNA polymerase III subunit psi n=2 Tax=Vibrio TaxID=662 RepID=UPI000C22D739|nr:DNA polymerase III subunit psi [Vibrio fluvialis]EKO3465239.1 DNA polymerase III subunit psi [Vibrio fluvialis]EKO3477743.1 DNA polymerase III subunit psi [Vibrio fluvialis]EKO3505787.1 DNA polymerase III subunit psi [Vibrio fluvialis]EKO3540199.1 DNA polymerase III subunit psi [Vibrio fluvialis]EKO3983158.1 DNA polymerase III subunit psi [Vibrio fluvialis]
MSDHQQQYLHAMGIQSWELVHPERLQGYQPTLAPLDEGCRLLLVCASHPTAAEAILFERVLKSFHLPLSAARHVYPHQLSQLELAGLEWIWLAGCDVAADTSANRLISPTLAEIDGHTQHRRDLWQQICSYGAQS